MAKRTYKYHYKSKGPNYEIDMTVDLSRFPGQVERAQFELDSQVMTDMVPFMPMDTGQFINVTRAMSASLAGSGTVVAAAPPMGRFLYNGLVMVDVDTGSAYARKGAKKVLLSEFGGKSAADRKLDFSTAAHPDAQDHWFDAAKEKNLDSWVRKAKKTAGGGKK